MNIKLRDKLKLNTKKFAVKLDTLLYNTIDGYIPRGDNQWLYIRDIADYKKYVLLYLKINLNVHIIDYVI